MRLSTIDRLVRKLEPVDTLVEKLCARLLAHKDAHADVLLCAHETVCYYSQACGVQTGNSHEICCINPNGSVAWCLCAGC